MKGTKVSYIVTLTLQKVSIDEKGEEVRETLQKETLFVEDSLKEGQRVMNTVDDILIVNY